MHTSALGFKKSNALQWLSVVFRCKECIYWKFGGAKYDIDGLNARKIMKELERIMSFLH